MSLNKAFLTPTKGSSSFSDPKHHFPTAVKHKWHCAQSECLTGVKLMQRRKSPDVRDIPSIDQESGLNQGPCGQTFPTEGPPMSFIRCGPDPMLPAISYEFKVTCIHCTPPSGLPEKLQEGSCSPDGWRAGHKSFFLPCPWTPGKPTGGWLVLSLKGGKGWREFGNHHRPLRLQLQQ